MSAEESHVRIAANRVGTMTLRLRLNSHLQPFRQSLRELLSPRDCKKWVHNPLLNFSVHAIVDQMVGVNAPI